jgi:hypothetical protein
MSILTKKGSRTRLSAVKLALFGLALLFAMPAWAVKDTSALPAVSEVGPAPENFLAQTKLATEKEPYNDDYLSYEIRIPKDWTDNISRSSAQITDTPIALSKTVPDIIARYVGPPVNFRRSYVTIEGQGVDHEISMKDWFVNFIIRKGFALNAMTEVSAQEARALYVHVEAEDTYAVLARVMVNGPRVVIVRHYLPQENYEQEKELQAHIVNSFRLTDGRNERIEKQIVQGFLDQSYFNYPVSWNLKERSTLTIERMSALLYQTKEIEDDQNFREKIEVTLDGHIRVNVISRLLGTTTAQEITKFRDGFKIPGYKIGALIGDVPHKFHESILKGRVQSYKLVPEKSGMKDYELAVGVLEGANYYYITSLVTPGREQDFYNWAKNMEAFRIVNESMRRSN